MSKLRVVGVDVAMGVGTPSGEARHDVASRPAIPVRDCGTATTFQPRVRRWYAARLPMKASWQIQGKRR
jgi:hypothetical protein